MHPTAHKISWAQTVWAAILGNGCLWLVAPQKYKWIIAKAHADSIGMLNSSVNFRESLQNNIRILITAGMLIKPIIKYQTLKWHRVGQLVHKGDRRIQYVEKRIENMEEFACW